MPELKFREKRDNRRGVQDQFRTILRRAREITAGMDRDAFNRRPGPGRWSPGECLDHLNVTARLYLPALTEAIESARAKGWVDRRRSGRTLLGRVAAWTQEPPSRLRMRTHAELEPARDLDPAAVLEEFEALHEEIIVRVNESRDLDRRRVRIASLLNRRLRLTLDDWFAFLAAHARRHLWQAAEAMERDGEG